MRTYQAYWACCAALLLPACGDLSTELWSQKVEVIYANSFETQADTTGWSILADCELVPIAPPGGGAQSVRVSGGCPIPHAATLVRTNERSGKFCLECYGKNLSHGGSVELYTVGHRDARIVIQVGDSSWVRYRTESYVEAGAEDTLMLAINSGGIVPSAILVDCLGIYHVK